MESSFEIKVTIATGQNKKYLIEELENQLENFVACLRHMITTDGHLPGTTLFLRNQNELQTAVGQPQMSGRIALSDPTPLNKALKTIESDA